jgi:exosortase
MASRKNYLWLTLAVLGGIVLWGYWPVLSETAERWSSNAQYSHGYLVPLFAAFLLWHRRHRIPSEPAGSWWSAPILGLGLALHLAGAYFFFDWFSAASLLPVLAGVALAVGGGRALAWSWPAIAFLAFMLPLPYRLEHALSHPLQRLATTASTYILQTIGLPAIAEGNTILLEEMRIGVVEACNGLGMLMTFFAMTAAVAMLMRGPVLDRVVVVCSAVPIALIANVLRIVITGLTGVAFGAEIADRVFHDLAGWIMMPLALGMLWIEMKIMARLLVEADEESPRFELGEVGATTVAAPKAGATEVAAPKRECAVL